MTVRLVSVHVRSVFPYLMTLDFTVMLYEFGLESCVIGKGTSFNVQENDLTLTCTLLFYHTCPIPSSPIQSYPSIVGRKDEAPWPSHQDASKNNMFRN